MTKRGLDDLLEGYRDPTSGRLTLDQRGRAVDSVRRSYISTLDQLNPDYAAARAAWSGPSQSLSALNMGETFLNKDPEQIQSALSNLSPSDQAFFRVGAARALQDRAGSASDGADLSKRLFATPRARSQIETAFGKDASDAFGQAMQSERAMNQTSNFMTGGSQTSNKLMDIIKPTLLRRALSDAVQGGLAGFMAHGMSGAATAAVGYPIANMGKELAARLAEHSALSQPENASELGRLLLTPGSAGADQLTATLAPAYARRATGRSRAAALGKALGKITPVVGLTGGALANQPQGQ